MFIYIYIPLYVFEATSVICMCVGKSLVFYMFFKERKSFVSKRKLMRAMNTYMMPWVPEVCRFWRVLERKPEKLSGFFNPSWHQFFISLYLQVVAKNWPQNWNIFVQISLHRKFHVWTFCFYHYISLRGYTITFACMWYFRLEWKTRALKLFWAGPFHSNIIRWKIDNSQYPRKIHVYI